MRVHNKTRFFLLLSVVLLAGLLLAACNLPEEPQAPESPLEEPTAVSPETEIKTLYVGPERVDCVGVAPQKCLLVKEDPNDEYTMFYDRIEGFAYETGYEYEIVVEVTTIENPPADASKFQYALVEEVSKTPVTEAQPETAVTQPETAVAQPEAAQTPLEGTRWVMEALVNSEGQLVSAVPGVEVTATFEDGQVSGQSGCNRYFASYTVDGNNLTVELGGSTMMACPDPLMVLEQEYLAALGSAASYQISDSELQILNSDGELVLAFEASQPVSLTGSLWQALSYNNGKEAVVSLIIGTEITAIFAEDGTLSGSAGCNNYTASYQVDGDQISIGPAASTRKACAEPEGIMEQEMAYLLALETANTYRIEGDRLELRTSDGALVASYQAAGEPQPAQPEAEEAAPVDPELVSTLSNLEYQSDYTASGTAPLTDGQYEEEAAPGSAARVNVTFVPQYTAVGELNGQQAAAVILATNTGGSGVFVDLAVVVEQDGQWVNVAATMLGDRVDVRSLTIEGNQIVVEMVTQGPGEPMCCGTQVVVQTYELQDDQLVQISSEILGNIDPATGELVPTQPDTGEAAPAQPEPVETAPAVSEAEEAPDIVGAVWEWKSFTDPVNGTVDIPDPEHYSMELRPSGLVLIRADCNRGGGSYTIDGSSITIEVESLTRSACPPGTLSEDFITSLNAAAIFFVQDGDLFIDLFADGGTMRFGQSS